ncbi:MAG: hypothetical protein H8D46_00140 [FCB group bacterium]|nr:hypothetical protein [FCB group bacterium]
MVYKIQKSVSAFLICFMLMSTAIAQDGLFHGSLGISLLNLQPRGQFGQFVDNNGWGIDLFGTMNLWQSPLSVGFNLLIANYGSETQHIPFNYWVGSLVTVEMETTNNFFAGHLFMRLKPYD